MKESMMNRRDVCNVLAISSAGLHRGMADGRFPRPYRIGSNSVRWKSSEIQSYIDKLEIANPLPVAPGCTTKGRRKK